MHNNASVIRFKDIHPIYRLSDTIFRIGAQIDVTQEFDDHHRYLWRLIHLLDGRNVGEVVHEMLSEFPDLERDDVIDGINLLDSFGFVETPPSFEHPEVPARLGPTANYLRTFSGIGSPVSIFVDGLRRSHITVLGLGGGGSTIVQLLAGLGPASLTIADLDTVDESNLGRQLLFGEHDIGRPKTAAARDRLNQLNSSLEVRAIDARMDSASDIVQVAKGTDLIICAMDEPPFIAQRRASRAAVALGIPCSFVLSQLSHGRVLSIAPGMTGCLDCLHEYGKDADDDYLSQLSSLFSSNDSPPSIAYGPAIYQLCAFVVDEAVRFLTGYAPPRTLGRQYEIDYTAGSSWAHEPWPPYEDACPACASPEKATRLSNIEEDFLR